MSGSVRASVVGGTGYTGGELVRLILGHPEFELGQVTSRGDAGRPVHLRHPNLRAHGAGSYVEPGDLAPCDVVFLCMPHGRAAAEIDRYMGLARLVVDLSSDFRLDDPGQYQRWYGEAHPREDLLGTAVYGLAEVSRRELGELRERGRGLVSGVGCNATAMVLALLPLARAGLIESAVCDVKAGSSEAGASPTAGSHHPERAGVVRTYSPWGHRHLGEVARVLGPIEVDATISAVGMVRGVMCTSHVRTTRRVDDRELWGVYREAYEGEPFVRIVRDRSGPHRLPNPSVVVGSNHADVGFAVDEASGRIVAMCALDNLVKGAAGSAVQAANLALGLDERLGLGFPGLHPV